MISPHVPALQRTARRIVKCDDLAQDAVQEALLSLWTSDEIPPKIGPWLLRTVVHRALHARRSAGRRRDYESAAAASAPTTAGLAVEDALDVRREGELALRELGELPEPQSVAFALRALLDLEYEEIAVATATPIGTVRSRIHRARKALRRRLAHRVDGRERGASEARHGARIATAQAAMARGRKGTAHG